MTAGQRSSQKYGAALNRNLFSRHVSSVTALMHFLVVAGSYLFIYFCLLIVYLYFGCHLIDEINKLLFPVRIDGWSLART